MPVHVIYFEQRATMRTPHKNHAQRHKVFGLAKQNKTKNKTKQNDKFKQPWKKILGILITKKYQEE